MHINSIWNHGDYSILIENYKAMEISKILTADILDIVFEGKNKEYGAYELRKTYGHRLRLSIAVMSSVVLLLVAGFLLANGNDMITVKTFDIPVTQLEKVIEPPIEEPIIPPPPKKEEVAVMERKNTTIVIVKEQDIPEDEKPPLIDDLDKAKLSLVNKDGPAFDNISAPIEEAVGKGIIERLKETNPDSVFLKVEIDSKYPGGTEAWRRFLIKNLSNNYPQDAADRGIQGKVVVKFIVDRNGNVSNIQAVEGPRELYELAEKVIKKSGKWEPAQQNGKIVNSYKSQPIIFSLGDQ